MTKQAKDDAWRSKRMRVLNHAAEIFTRRLHRESYNTFTDASAITSIAKFSILNAAVFDKVCDKVESLMHSVE